MSESGGMSVNRLTAGGQNVATDVKGNITTLPANLRPTGATTAMNLTWDSDNKLRSADIDANGTADVNFQYDALGRRVARSGTGGSVVYVQMDQQTIADYPVGGAATTPTFRYVFASYIDEPVVRKTAGTGGTLVYFHRNQQYSVYALTDSSGNVSERYAYTAYGQPTFLNASATVQTSSAANNRYTYTGREWDQTIGLTHFRARWISGVVGRFISRDSIGYGDGLSLYRNFFGIRDLDPTGFNRYVRSYTEYHLIGCHFSPDGEGCDLVCEYELQVYEQEGELIPPVPPGILVGLGPWRRAPEKPLTELFFIEVDPQYCGPCPTEFEHANPLPVPNDFDDPPTPWTPTRGLPPHPPLPPPPPLPPRNIA